MDMLQGCVSHFVDQNDFPHFPPCWKALLIICEPFKMYPRIKELLTSENYSLGQILRTDLHLLYEKLEVLQPGWCRLPAFTGPRLFSISHHCAYHQRAPILTSFRSLSTSLDHITKRGKLLTPFLSLWFTPSPISVIAVQLPALPFMPVQPENFQFIKK